MSTKIAPPMKTGVSPLFGLPGAESRAGTRSHSATLALDREHLLDRLARLHSILPVFAQELAITRRQAAALRDENHRLLEEVRRLRRDRGESAHPQS